MRAKLKVERERDRVGEKTVEYSTGMIEGITEMRAKVLEWE